MKLRLTHLSAVVLTAALGSGCDVHVGENGVSVDVASGKATEEWMRTYTLAKGGTLEISNTNGAIVVDRATGGQVEVTATRVARASTEEEAQALLQKTSIAEAVSPTKIAIQAAAGNGFEFGRRSINVEYHVRVPAGLQVSVKTENGGIGLHDVDGTLTASTTNGGIRGTNLSGSVSAHIVNGGIVIDVARLAGPIELDAVNGGIRLDLPADANADIEARAVNGGVTMESGLTLTTSDRTQRHVAGRLNAGGIKITASTVNGGVRLRGRHNAGATQTDKEGFDEAGPILVEQKH